MAQCPAQISRFAGTVFHFESMNVTVGTVPKCLFDHLWSCCDLDLWSFDLKI